MDNYFTASDNVRLYYRTEGRGEPLIMLTGFGRDSGCWEKNYPALGERFTVIAPDHRGHGRSETPVSGWHIERLAKDLEELAAHLGLTRFSVLAHSMGNAVFWCYLQLFGDAKIEKYVLEDEAPCLLCAPDWTEDEKDSYTGSFRIASQWDAPVRLPDSEEGGAAREFFLSQLMKDHLCRDWRDIVPTIAVPTLIVMGGGSHFASPLLWDWLHRSIKGSGLVVIPAEEGGGHAMHSSAPDRFNETVLAFLTGSDGKRQNTTGGR